jgi:hypothetical protein
MKTPRVTDFDPKVKDVPALKSSLESMPTIEKPKRISENASIPERQKSSKMAFQHSSKTEIQNASIPERQHSDSSVTPVNRVPTEKVTYRFHPEAKYAVEDMKSLLERKHGIKASLEEIAENCILIAYDDLLELQNTSKLAIKLSSIPAKQKSR